MAKVYVISKHLRWSHADIDLDGERIDVVKVVDSEVKALKYICERFIEACEKIDGKTIYIDHPSASYFSEIRECRDIYIVTDFTDDCTTDTFYSYKSYDLE